jgi:hypothetical protein
LRLVAPPGVSLLLGSRPGVRLEGERLTLPGDSTCWLTKLK